MPTPRLRNWLRSTGHVAGLFAIAVAQPVLDILGRAPEFFVAHGADTLDLLILVAVLVVFPALVLGAVLGVATLVGRRTADAVTALLVGLLAATLAVQVGYRLGAAGWGTTAAVGLAGLALAGIAWLRWRAVRRTLTVLAASVVVVPLVFLSTDGIRSLMRVNPTQAATLHTSRLAPVVLIVFEELPLVSLVDAHDRLDATRYPNLAALAADGVWFRNATTVSDYTRWALPAILSGRYPRAGSVPTSGDHPDTLFRALASSHRMEVFEPLTAMCPPQLSGKIQEPRLTRQRRVLADVQIVASYALLPPAARAGLPDITQGWAGFAENDDGFLRVWREGERMDPVATAVSFLDGITGADEQPTLYFMHTMASHHPLRWLPSGQEIANVVGLQGVLPPLLWGKSDWPVAQGQQGKLVQAGLVDALVGRLRTRLQQAGLYERALIVVTADHGISFTPGTSIRTFTEAGAGGIVPVPLIVKLPADRRILAPGTVDDSNVETIDILPTIADGLGMALPWRVDGSSALRERAPRADKRIYFNDARTIRRFDPDEVARLRVTESRRQAGLFGNGLWPTLNPPGLDSLVGRSVNTLTINDTAAGPRLQINNMFDLDDVNLAGPTLPVQVKGRFLGVDPGKLGSVFLAIALNGTIVATTRTWSESGEWMALVPPDRLRNGRNDLRVFFVDPARPTSLTGTGANRELPDSLNLMSPDAAEYGVSYEGFYHVETAGSTPFHWTHDEAKIAVPIRPQQRPSSLAVDVLFAGKEGKRLRILLDTCEVASETLPKGRWSMTVPLGSCAPSGRWITIRLLSDTHRPGGKDRRRLGVALAGVALGY
ncbi:MAG: hypothetical protein A3F69_05575 [Acidobacteria bacterium RIFCSPLOWO2_12_FULL_66_10]|nr:MAG: hypothetical protein A3F69_05575 [Acidobacteria bacterium RIFCSPLOWO2_12_FULL_66_10]